MKQESPTFYYKFAGEYRELISLSDAAEYSNRCTRSLQNDVKQGKLMPFYIQRLVFFDKSHLKKRD